MFSGFAVIYEQVKMSSNISLDESCWLIKKQKSQTGYPEEVKLKDIAKHKKTHFLPIIIQPSIIDTTYPPAVGGAQKHNKILKYLKNINFFLALITEGLRISEGFIKH